MSEQKTPLSRTLTLFVQGMILKEIEKQGRALPCQVVAIDPSHTVVTVSFQIQNVQMPQVRMAVGGPEYIRFPIQIGSVGVCFPVDTYIGQVTGLGTGVAGLTRRANLSTLVFFPTGNINFSATDNAQAVVLYGPDGIILRDSASQSKVTLTPADIDINAQTNLTGEAGADIGLTAGSQIEFSVGSTSFLMNGSEIVMTAAGVTATLNATGFVVTGLVEGVDVTATAAVSAGSSLMVAGKEMSGHMHDVHGVQTGGSTVVSGPPL